MKSFQPSEALSVCFRSVLKRPKDSRVKGLEPSLLLVIPSLNRHQHVLSASAAVASRSCTHGIHSRQPRLPTAHMALVRALPILHTRDYLSPNDAKLVPSIPTHNALRESSITLMGQWRQIIHRNASIHCMCSVAEGHATRFFVYEMQLKALLSGRRLY